MSARDPSEEAFARARAGDVAGALESLRARVAVAPEDAAAWLTLGMVLDGTADAEAALAAHLRSVALDGGAVLARVLLARALERVGRADEADAQLAAAESLAPSHGGIARERGSLAYARGDHEAALAHLSRAAALASSPEEASRVAYALGLVHEARRDVGAAIAAYRDAVRVNPAHEEAWRTLADALAQVGEHARAVEALDALLARRPHDTRAAHNREVLREALTALRARRWLGGDPRALATSALVEGAAMHEAPAPDGELRYVGLASRLDAALDAGGRVHSLFLSVADPPIAARADAGAFGVTVVGEAGARADTTYATAASLTLLREALGIPMTDAAALLARLLASPEPVRAEGADLGFTSIDGRHGLRITRAP